MMSYFCCIYMQAQTPTYSVDMINTINYCYPRGSPSSFTCYISILSPKYPSQLWTVQLELIGSASQRAANDIRKSPHYPGTHL